MEVESHPHNDRSKYVLKASAVQFRTISSTRGIFDAPYFGVN